MKTLSSRASLTEAQYSYIYPVLYKESFALKVSVFWRELTHSDLVWSDLHISEWLLAGSRLLYSLGSVDHCRHRAIESIRAAAICVRRSPQSNILLLSNVEIINQTRIELHWIAAERDVMHQNWSKKASVRAGTAPELHYLSDVMRGGYRFRITHVFLFPSSFLVKKSFCARFTFETWE